MVDSLIKPPTGGPTKDEILAIAIQKLGLRSEDIFVDIGCGTGKVTLTVAPMVSWVHSIDIRDEAFRWTKARITETNLKNITLYHDDAVKVIAGLEKIDVAFVGGSKNLWQVIGELYRHQVHSVVITAVMLETLNIAVKYLQEYNMFREVIHIQISKSIPISNGIMLKPIDPVFIIYGGMN